MAATRTPPREGPPGVAPRGRPPRLAHLVPGSPTHQRRERALAVPPALATRDSAARAGAGLPEPVTPGPDVLCLPNPEWLPHRLTVSGPAADLAAFRAAARGPGQIAWSSDYESDREAWTAALLALRARRPEFSAESARVLAREMRELIEALDLAAADSLADRRCPFDLNALVPLPATLLRLGPEDPAVAAWLWEHWGTTWMLRGVEETPPGRAGIPPPEGHDTVCLGFWSADWTPWRALAAVRRRWPALSLQVELLPIAE